MIVSWNWLKTYVPLEMSSADLEHRLAMSGLNHESTKVCGDDLAIDLEVTSNRPDCLGHIGVAREAAVLYDLPLTIPAPAPPEVDEPVAEACRLRIDCPELCRRYTARVIRGVKVGPSPTWLAKRLATIGIAVVNNIVDVTNYVLMECGQPLHAFDFNGIDQQQIIVREARQDEPFRAIDHKQYVLQPGMCVIADASRPIALGGVMGGEDTEVTLDTTDILLESAEFSPLAVRRAARALRLHSPSSYRFERGVDEAGVAWASLRASELILELAGGSLLAGMLDSRPAATVTRPKIVLRISQIPRVLGIELDRDAVLGILQRLGLEWAPTKSADLTFLAPSWRRDLKREIDLIEEVGRIHGYDQIPEDVGVPMVPSYRTESERITNCVRQTLVSAGFFEAMTPSLVDEKTSAAFSPWTSADPIRSNTAALRGADCLRRSLTPSLLAARQLNQSLSNPESELFETAHVYLPAPDGRRPREESILALASGGDFKRVKGVIEGLLSAVGVELTLDARPCVDLPLLDRQAACRLEIGGELVGYVGAVSTAGLKQFGLRTATTIAEIKMSALVSAANTVRQYMPLSPLPSITHDLNLIVAESVRWADLAETARQAGGALLEEIRYRETYRDANRDGEGNKALFFSIVLRSEHQTLTGEQAEEIRSAILAACETAWNAKLLD